LTFPKKHHLPAGGLDTCAPRSIYRSHVRTEIGSKSQRCLIVGVGKPEVESASGLPVIWESAGTFFDKPTCRF
jgi:hypothetical protein